MGSPFDASLALPRAPNREGRVEQVDEDHFISAGSGPLQGEMIPFLAAGARLCDREDETPRTGRPQEAATDQPAGAAAHEETGRADLSGMRPRES